MKAALRRLRAPFEAAAMVANAIGTAVILGLVAIMNVDVVARGAFSQPIRGVFEIVIFSLALIVYLQLPDVARSGKLTRSDGFLSLSRSRFPAFGQALGRGIDAAAAAFMAMIAWTAWPAFLESAATCRFLSGAEFGGGEGGALARFAGGWARCEYYGTPGIFTAPWFPVKLAIAFSATLCAIMFLFRAVIGEEESSGSDLPPAESGS